MKHEELTKKIIGCAYKVFNNMGYGFPESVYQNSLFIELKNEGIDVAKEVPINVYYDNQVVGFFLSRFNYE